jgi:hypothetical protein
MIIEVMVTETRRRVAIEVFFAEGDGGARIVGGRGGLVRGRMVGRRGGVLGRRMMGRRAGVVLFRIGLVVGSVLVMDRMAGGVGCSFLPRKWVVVLLLLMMRVVIQLIILIMILRLAIVLLLMMMMVGVVVIAGVVILSGSVSLLHLPWSMEGSTGD